MDIYYEHLVEMRKDGRSKGLLFLIWAVTLAIVVLTVLLLFPHVFSVIIIAAAVFGAVKLTKMLDGEYEYILTNGEIDIDVITAKSKRSRVITFDCADIESVEHYSADKHINKDSFAKIGVYCNKDDKYAYTLIIKHKSLGKISLTLDIPEKMQEKMLPFMDKLLAREAFKD